MLMADPSLNEALTRAISDLDALIETAKHWQIQRDDAQSKLDEADEAVGAQSVLVESLRAAAQRYGDAEPEVTPLGPPEPTNPHLLQSIPRTDAIVWALKQIGVPVGPGNITRWLNNHGRSDSAGAVGATLGHLATQGRVKSLGYGQWVVVSPPITPEEVDKRLLEAFPGAAPGQ